MEHFKIAPLWDFWDTGISFPTLEEDITVDVAIIGGGITGITTALLLVQNGFTVGVLEAKGIGKGTTGRSTGNLYDLTEDLFSILLSKYDKETLTAVIGVRRRAMELIEENIWKYRIDCDHAKRPMYLLEDGPSTRLLEEQKSAREAGIPVSAVRHDDVPFTYERGLQLKDQAQLNPLRYIQGLARQLDLERGMVFENSAVQKIKEEEGRLVLYTAQAKVSAQYVVQATHSPKGKQLEFHTTLAPYREYGLAVKLKPNSFSPGIYWKYLEKEHYSIRSYTRNDEAYLIAIGKSHKTGQEGDNRKSLEELHQFVKTNFKVGDTVCQWGAQNYKPADHLPYIGKIKEGSNQYVATGFSTDGLVYGTVAATILADTIAGKDHPHAKLFRATRHRPIKAAKRFLKENINVASQMLQDLIVERGQLEKVPLNGAMVMELQGKKVAIHKSLDGEYHIVSAICTHMGCVVHWNELEKTWDCPCHGSRFDPQGNILEGPALAALEKKDFFQGGGGLQEIQP